MLNIGIVGAENSHTAAIAKVLNVEKRVRGVRVTHVWGETKAFAEKAAAAGEIPNIVKQPEDLIGQVDAAAVDHRHGKFHLPAAAPLLEAKLPLFIDKPFCYRKAEGAKFLARAKKLKVPVCSFSTLPKQASYKAFAKKMRQLGEIQTLVATGPCDIKSKWGGVFFYGIHQVDMILRILGYDLHDVGVHKGKGGNHVATISWKDGGVAAANLIQTGRPDFHLSVIGDAGRLDRTIEPDSSMYSGGIRRFVRAFRRGVSEDSPESMLGPVAVLEGLEKAMKEKRRVRVSA